MGWTDKAHKKHKIHKMIEQAMSTPEYQAARKRDQEQAALKAYCNFCLVACDYLQIKHGYKKKGIVSFLKYASDIMKYITTDEHYFVDMNQVMIDECGIDVLEFMGMKVVEEGEKNGEGRS